RLFVFFFQAEDGIRDFHVTGVQTCALPISSTLFHLIQRAGEKKQWKHVVTIGRRLEQLYALKKKWDGWLKILNLLRMAASALKEIGRASCRERVEMMGVGGCLTKKGR